MAADVVLSDVKARQPPLLRVVLAATVGNVSDWFDFLVYGYFAVTIAEVFSRRQSDHFAARYVWCVRPAYVVRPLGAAMIGAYTDRGGRKAGLTLSIALMMIGTTMMVIPSYATIGVAAAILITIARLLQGFSVGGEFGRAVAFLVEHGSARNLG